MKKLLLAGIGFCVLTLSGCASTKIPMFPDYSITGEFPLNYIDIVQEKVGSNFKTDFVPKGHYDGWNSGWMSCLTNKVTKERIAVVVRNNNVKQIIRKENVPNIDYKCDVINALGDRDWTKRWSVYSRELDKVKNDPTKEYLFGKYPEHPNVIVKSYMFNILHSPLSAQYKDLKISKTYFTDAEDDYRLHYAYSIEVKINEKDKLDKYEKRYLGYKTYYFLVKDDIVLEHLKSSFK